MVELVTGFPAGTTLELVTLFDEHKKFLELDFTPGETSAKIQTKTLLDADALQVITWQAPMVRSTIKNLSSSVLPIISADHNLFMFVSFRVMANYITTLIARTQR